MNDINQGVFKEKLLLLNYSDLISLRKRFCETRIYWISLSLQKNNKHNSQESLTNGEGKYNRNIKGSF